MKRYRATFKPEGIRFQIEAESMSKARLAAVVLLRRYHREEAAKRSTGRKSVFSGLEVLEVADFPTVPTMARQVGASFVADLPAEAVGAHADETPAEKTIDPTILVFLLFVILFWGVVFYVLWR